MRNLLALAFVTFLFFGCFGGRKAARLDSGNGRPGMIVAPANGLIGRVAYVNAGARFVIVNFPVGRLPAVNQHLTVYRKGLKVGEVKITSLQDDDNLVANQLAGSSEVGDQVRDK